MKSAGIGFLVLLSAGSTLSFAQLPKDFQRKFEEAERQIVRLPPAAFPELPGKVAGALRRRGCTIPQEAFAKKPHNVIRGQFARPGQTDWAVLCSVKGVSTILVFWNGAELNPDAIGAGPDSGWLQVVGEDQIGYSRAISPVGRAFILGHYQAYGGPKPPPIDHQGIDDAFVGKASVTWYLHGGKWLSLTGAD